MKVRFIPWNLSSPSSGIPPGNIQIQPQTPLMTGLGQQPLAGQRIIPARFTVATDYNYPAIQGQVTWETQGVSPTSRTVILTNVKTAQVVYTALMPYPSTWDPLFRAAMVAYLASEIALPLAKDKKFGLTLRGQQIAIAKEKIGQARLTDGNEGFYSSDIQVDWMRTRNVGGAFRGTDGGLGPGVLGYGYDSCAFSSGSAY